MQADASQGIQGSSGSGGRLAAALLLGALALGLRVPFLAMPGFPADQALFTGWAYQSQAGGLASVYDRVADGRPFCNYPPLYVYVLRTLAALQNRFADPAGRLGPQTQNAVWSGASDDRSAAIAKVVHKVPAVIADAAVVFLLCYWLWPRAGRAMAVAVGFGYAVAPAVIQDSSVWGQVDGIPALLMVLSLEAGRRRELVWMAAWAALALLMKAQAMMIAPIWAAVAYEQGRNHRSDLLKAGGAAAAIVAIVLFPFADALDGVWAAYAHAAKYYPFTHFNGFSAWFLGNPLAAPQLEGALSKAYVHDDMAGFLGVTPRMWGFLGLLVLWGRVMMELLRRRSDDASLRWAARVLPLGFFLLSTQMHERYLFPAIALWAWAARPTLLWWLSWIGVNLCAAINQFWVWPGPRWDEFPHMLEGILHHEGVGVAASVALILVLTLSVLERPERHKVSCGPPASASRYDPC